VTARVIINVSSKVIGISGSVLYEESATFQGFFPCLAATTATRFDNLKVKVRVSVFI